jgi:hypothetical protein
MRSHRGNVQLDLTFAPNDFGTLKPMAKSLYQMQASVMRLINKKDPGARRKARSVIEKQQSIS